MAMHTSPSLNFIKNSCISGFGDLPAALPWPGLNEYDPEALVRRLTGDNATGVVSYGTEAGQFQEAGYSAVVCGPGDISQAHQVDEYLEVSEFEAGHRFMQALIEELA